MKTTFCKEKHYTSSKNNSRIENTSKGGKKASNKGQEEVEDFKLLSDHTLKILILI